MGTTTTTATAPTPAAPSMAADRARVEAALAPFGLHAMDRAAALVIADRILDAARNTATHWQREGKVADVAGVAHAGAAAAGAIAAAYGPDRRNGG